MEKSTFCGVKNKNFSFFSDINSIAEYVHHQFFHTWIYLIKFFRVENCRKCMLQSYQKNSTCLSIHFHSCPRHFYAWSFHYDLLPITALPLTFLHLLVPTVSVAHLVKSDIFITIMHISLASTTMSFSASQCCTSFSNLHNENIPSTTQDMHE